MAQHLTRKDYRETVTEDRRGARRARARAYAADARKSTRTQLTADYRTNGSI